jgi:hypothetical protein
MPTAKEGSAAAAAAASEALSLSLCTVCVCWQRLAIFGIFSSIALSVSHGASLEGSVDSRD